MPLIAAALILSLSATPTGNFHELMQLGGPWQVKVPVLFTEAAETLLDVPKTPVVEVRGERYPQLRLFNPKTGGWMRGERLRPLIAQECSVTDALFVETLTVKSAPDHGKVFVRGVDYEIDPQWATVGRLEGGAIQEGMPVYLDYDYQLSRLHLMVANLNQLPRLIPGEPGGAIVLPPNEPKGWTKLGHVWVPSGTKALSEENLFPVHTMVSDGETVRPSQAARFLPKTLAKLEAGEKVRILAWGDSVTVGGGVLPDMEKRYQDQFVRRLRAAYPKAEIEMLTAAWGGSNSAQWLKQPEGAAHHFQRDVLDPKADLVTIEFVNDAYLTEAQTIEHYAMLLERIQGVGSELAVITPHLVRPDWMGVESMKFDDDPRPYVKGLRHFAAQYKVALADASKQWTELWRYGIPYTTLLANAINHPDERGHRIFARTLMRLFK